jgi:simple sugar transport system ATP-binding protein
LDASGAAELALELRGITKRFGALTANDAVDLQLRRGEIHALLGENGAGKSTLMNVVYGMLSPDEGQILVDGQVTTVASPRDAMDQGIGMVFQHFMLIPVMTVAENLVLGNEGPAKRGLLDIAGARQRTRELSEKYGLRVDPDARVSDVSVGMQQRIEILRALDRGAKILVLDEPTAVLTAQETAELIAVLRGLRDAGTSVVFITHKLHEVLEVADRVTVLRRGKTIGTIDTAGADEISLARMMVGRDVVLRVEKEPGTPGEALLEIDAVHAIDDRGLPAVDGVSLTVSAGEIVAVAGIDGNGQTELIDALTGLQKVSSGTVKVAGRGFHSASARQMLDAGVGHIPEDRQRRGLVLEFSIAENIALHDYAKPPDAKWGWLFPSRMVQRARTLIREFDVRGGGPLTRAGGLSGGNQQKLVAAREIARDPSVLIAAQPTRGLDVGAIEYLHRRLVAERDEGRAILLVSLELEEILSLSDRILVIYEGQIVGEHTGEVTEEQIGLEMLGGGEAAAA